MTPCLPTWADLVKGLGDLWSVLKNMETSNSEAPMAPARAAPHSALCVSHRQATRQRGTEGPKPKATTGPNCFM